MSRAFCKNFNNGYPLRGYLLAIHPQFLDDCFKSFLMVSQQKSPMLDNNYYYLTSILFKINLNFTHVNMATAVVDLP